MIQRKYGWTLEVDIHGMHAAEAKRQLELLLGLSLIHIWFSVSYFFTL